MARGFPGRGAARQDEAGARDAARGEAQVAPALDDAFAREVGDFESLDALQTAVRTDLDGARRARGGCRRAPAAHRPDHRGEPVRRAAELGEPAHRRATSKAYQVPEDGARRSSRSEFRPMAERQVRRDLIIDTIAEREKLDATESGHRRPRRRSRDASAAPTRAGLRVAAEGGSPARDRARASPKTRCSSG